MLKLIEKPDAKLLSDLSEKSRLNNSLTKHTADDTGDVKFYTTSDGKRNFLRICETTPPSGDGPAKYDFRVYEILPALGAAANPAPAILTVK